MNSRPAIFLQDSSATAAGAGFRRAFTMMELTVSIAILVVIILSVGVTFNGASRSVSVSNATMEMMSGVRAIQGVIEQDVSHIDRNGYIAIRCCLNNPNTAMAGASGKTFAELSYRFDQISFISTGSFNNRTGADTANPFTDSSTASAAHIWLGHGVIEGSKPGYQTPNQSIATTVNQFPTGAVQGSPLAIKEMDLTLLRHQTLLMPGPVNGQNQISPAGNKVMAYSGLQNLPGNSITGQQEGFPAHISSSRFSVAALTPAQVYQAILRDTGTGGGQAQVPEIDLYTYRFRALAAVYDTEVTANPFVNGYFRTTPVLMQGVTSFKIEWTDGKIYPPGDAQGRGGQLKWYGPTQWSGGGLVDPSGNNPQYGNDGSNPDAAVEQFNINGISHTINGGGVNLGDHYIAVFNYSNREKWPKALRFTMHIASERLAGGRDFVQVVNLPQ